MGRREQVAADRPDRPGRCGVRLDDLRPARSLRDPVQHQGRVLDRLHAGLGKRRQGADGPADELQRPRQLLVRRRRALQRALDAAAVAAGPVEPDDEAATAEGEPLDGVERAQQPDLPHAAVQACRQDVARRERVQLREDLQRGLQRRALAVSRAAAGRARRVWRHRPEGQRRAVHLAAVGRPADLPYRCAQVRDEDLRRLRAQSVSRRRRRGVADVRAEGQDEAAHTDRQHQHAARAGLQVLRTEAPVDHRVRLPDQPAGQALRRLVREAGAVPDAGVRDRPQEPAHRHDALVPRARRAERQAAGSPASRRPRAKQSPRGPRSSGFRAEPERAETERCILAGGSGDL